jgi:hypothetical protein
MREVSMKAKQAKVWCCERKRFCGTPDDNDSSDSLEEQEEVSSEEILMNQLDTSEEKLPTKRTCGIIFSDTTLAASEPRTPKCRRRSDEDNIDDNDDDDDLWM